MNVQPLSLDHGRHSGEWDPSTSDGANIARYHVRQALAAIKFLFARARADNRTTDSVSALAERDQATLPYLGRDASGRGQNSAALITTLQDEATTSFHGDGLASDGSPCNFGGTSSKTRHGSVPPRGTRGIGYAIEES